MLLTTKDLISLHFEVGGFLENGVIIREGLVHADSDIELKIVWSRILRFTTLEFEGYKKLEQELYKKYGEAKDNSIVVGKENMQDFLKELEALQATEIEVTPSQFWGNTDVLGLLKGVKSKVFPEVVFKMAEHVDAKIKEV